ncbi:MAG: hypothetical protein H6707_17835 [Deltaproteobacteria bacterium]|nr:hypothetical protein [Deltaproteobacteria bacterium]
MVRILTALLCLPLFAPPVSARTGSVWKQPAGPLRHKLGKINTAKPPLLIHQSDGAYHQPFRDVGRRAVEWPQALRDRVTWTTIGGPSWVYGERRRLPQYAYKLKPGWQLLPIDLLFSAELEQLIATWRNHRNGKPPENQFSARLIRDIESELYTLAERNGLWDELERGIPTHSDFYQQFGIAGFYGQDYGNVRAYDPVAILLPIGSKLRLKRQAR